jgi:hypothetical protein
MQPAGKLPLQVIEACANSQCPISDARDLTAKENIWFQARLQRG